MRQKIIRIQHPSGKLFDVYKRFVKDHAEGSFFQSESFIHLAERWPDADWSLFVAIRQEGLKDPGVRSSGGYDTGFSQRDDTAKPSERHKPVADADVLTANAIAGSMLAIVVKKTTGMHPLVKPFAGVFKKIGTQTRVYNGPLLAPNTRLQREITTKLLFEALHRYSEKFSASVKLSSVMDITDFLPLFREMGYKDREREHLFFDIPSDDENAMNGLPQADRSRYADDLRAANELLKNPTAARLDEFFLLHTGLHLSVGEGLTQRKGFIIKQGMQAQNESALKEHYKHHLMRVYDLLRVNTVLGRVTL